MSESESDETLTQLLDEARAEIWERLTPNQFKDRVLITAVINMQTCLNIDALFKHMEIRSDDDTYPLTQTLYEYLENTTVGSGPSSSPDRQNLAQHIAAAANSGGHTTPPPVRASRPGVAHPPSDIYKYLSASARADLLFVPRSPENLYYVEKAITAQRAAFASPLEVNRPLLHTASVLTVPKFREQFDEYHSKGGLFSFISCIDQIARNHIMAKLIVKGIPRRKWKEWPEVDLVQAILDKYCGHQIHIHVTPESLFKPHAMKAGQGYDAMTFKTANFDNYISEVLVLTDTFPDVLATIGWPSKTQLFADGCEPEHFKALLYPKIAHLEDWGDILAEANMLANEFESHRHIEMARKTSYPNLTKPKHLKQTDSTKKANHAKAVPKKNTAPVPPKQSVPTDDSSPLMLLPAPAERSSCPNCPKSRDLHLLNRCPMMCFIKECKGDDPHVARTCDVCSGRSSSEQTVLGFYSTSRVLTCGTRTWMISLVRTAATILAMMIITVISNGSR